MAAHCDRPHDISLFMLPVTSHRTNGPLIVMVHWLGGSANSWIEVAEGCSSRGLACAALDLPGFGRASSFSSPEGDTFTVGASVDAIIATIRSLRSDRREPWLLAGHSMGGKFASMVARAALDGTPGLEDLRGLILISPSPPGPEPMDEAVRRNNIRSLGSSTLVGQKDRAHAEAFVDANTGKLALLDTVRTRTTNDLLRMNRSAFVDWFTTGSREDWASRVGIIPLPVLILAGTEESALGLDAQREHTVPHFSQATLVPLEGAGHLSPLERPTEIADRIVAFLSLLGLPLHNPVSLNSSFQGLIDSELTSPQTRAVLNRRLVDDASDMPNILTPEDLLTLRAVVRRIIPDCPLDLASRVHRWLAQSARDGWRHDTLPPDVDAWRIGLHSLNDSSLRDFGVPFSALDPARQDEVLVQARDGNLKKSLLDTFHLSESPKLFTAAQMSDWFGDLHAELTRIYIADPRTMQRIGFTGFADEGGFTYIRLNERENFEHEELAR